MPSRSRRHNSKYRSRKRISSSRAASRKAKTHQTKVNAEEQITITKTIYKLLADVEAQQERPDKEKSAHILLTFISNNLAYFACES